MTKTQLIEAVKSRIDEKVPENELTLVLEANLSINTISETIESFIDESAIEILRTAPISILPLKLSPSAITVSNLVGSSDAPDDFLRFGYAKFAAWKRPVYDAIEFGSKAYNVQRNEYTRAGYSKPVVAVGKLPTGVYRFEFYTIAEADKNTGKEIAYVGYPSTGESITEENDILPISMSWLIASKTLKAFKLNDAAKLAYEEYLNTLK